MLPDPLHPAVVHFPIVLAVLLPLFLLGGLVAVRRGVAPARAWALPLVVTAALAVSAFVATRTGAGDEERVEEVVAESAIHDHEEAAERFLVLSEVLLLVAALGLLRGYFGTSARFLAAAGSIAVLAAGVQTGRAGGELVYREGAASAYTSSATGDTGRVTDLLEHGDD
jgi:uncharacterized membrane protein